MDSKTKLDFALPVDIEKENFGQSQSSRERQRGQSCTVLFEVVLELWQQEM